LVQRCYTYRTYIVWTISNVIFSAGSTSIAISSHADDTYRVSKLRCWDGIFWIL